MLRHHQKPDVVQMKTFSRDEPFHGTLEKCPVHPPAETKIRKVPLEIPLPPQVYKPNPDSKSNTGSHKHSQPSQSGIISQSVSFPVEKTGTIRYVTSGTLKHDTSSGGKHVDSNKPRQNITS